MDEQRHEPQEDDGATQRRLLEGDVLGTRREQQRQDKGQRRRQCIGARPQRMLGADVWRTRDLGAHLVPGHAAMVEVVAGKVQRAA